MTPDEQARQQIDPQLETGGWTAEGRWDRPDQDPFGTIANGLRG
jgi:hypothetical protein